MNKYEEKNFENILGLDGFSDTLLKNHFKLYAGYVTNTNNLADILQKVESKDEAKSPQVAEIKRRFGWEYNGMRLHELYFENLTKDQKSIDDNAGVKQLIEKNFGSFENWKQDLKNTASLRGIGWVIVYYDLEGEKLFNVWIEQHDGGHLSGAKPILVMDVFEHAYITDYELNRGEYIGAFINAIDWEVVSQRLE